VEHETNARLRAAIRINARLGIVMSSAHLIEHMYYHVAVKRLEWVRLNGRVARNRALQALTCAKREPG
jgi:hypothetical protein